MSPTVSPPSPALDPLAGIDGIQTMLELLSEATGRRITLIARVSPDSWRCCAIRDGAGFGLKAGDTLDVETTF